MTRPDDTDMTCPGGPGTKDSTLKRGGKGFWNNWALKDRRTSWAEKENNSFLLTKNCKPDTGSLDDFPC